MKKFLVFNHIKSPILYQGTGPRCRLAWRSWLVYAINMLSCRISWIPSICVAKASVLAFLILLEGGSADSKLMQGWNPLFAKKGDIFMVSDLMLLPVNSAKGGQSGQSS